MAEYASCVGRKLSRQEISDDVTRLGWRYNLGLVRTSIRVGSLAQAAEVAQAVTALAGDSADGSLSPCHARTTGTFATGVAWLSWTSARRRDPDRRHPDRRQPRYRARSGAALWITATSVRERLMSTVPPIEDPGHADATSEAHDPAHDPAPGEARAPEASEAHDQAPGEARAPETGETWVALLHRPGRAAPRTGACLPTRGSVRTYSSSAGCRRPVTWWRPGR